MTSDYCAEIDEEVPVVSLVCGVAMALVIALLKSTRRRRRQSVGVAVGGK